MFDCDEHGGAGAVVPGSHILPDAPGQTLKTPLASGYNEKMGEWRVARGQVRQSLAESQECVEPRCVALSCLCLAAARVSS